MYSSRRGFLGWLGASSFSLASGATPSFRAFEDAGHAPVTDAWDVSWTERLRGKFRAVFDSPEIAEGAALFRAIVWWDHHKEVYGTARADMNPVLVIRHEAIPLIMNDAYWARFEAGKAAKFKDPSTKKWFVRNPILHTPDGAPPPFADYNLASFMRDGGIVLGCNVAFGEIVARYMAMDKLSEEAADAKARADVIPGCILQPSGVFAVLRSQEAGCAYMLAS
jgi:hypothetical protein